MITKYNAGLAPIVIVLILVGVVVVGGGVYFAVTGDSEIKVADQATTSPSSSTSITKSPTKTVVSTATPTTKPVATKAPVVTLKFATIGDAVNSGKNVVCEQPWWTGKESAQHRNKTYVTGSTIKIVYENKTASGPLAVEETTYVPGDAKYATVLKFDISTNVCW